MVERGRLQWQRQKKSSPASQLKVNFLGEAGVDTGALRKEFLVGVGQIKYKDMPSEYIEMFYRYIKVLF